MIHLIKRGRKNKSGWINKPFLVLSPHRRHKDIVFSSPYTLFLQQSAVVFTSLYMFYNYRCASIEKSFPPHFDVSLSSPCFQLGGTCQLSLAILSACSRCDITTAHLHSACPPPNKKKKILRLPQHLCLSPTHSFFLSASAHTAILI